MPGLLAQVAPHVMLAGPSLANPIHHQRWVTTLIDGAQRSLGLVTIHRYPFTGCAGRRGPAPTPPSAAC